MKQVECLFVDKDVKNVSSLISQRVDEFEANPMVPRLVCFPEGTTTNGTVLLPFRTGVFLKAKPVQPIVIKHAWKNFSPSWETIPEWVYMIRLLTQVYHNVEIIKLPIYYPKEEDSDPTVYAKNLRDLMSQVSEIPLGTSNREDKMKFHGRIMKGELKWNKYYQ
jgi:lysophosphatidylcholine acyltransferase/lyso-PAF acetyltransferase